MMLDTVPWSVTFAAWVPFPIVAIVGFFASFLYYWYFKSKFRFSTAFLCVSLVVVSLILIILIPIDVYLVSSTKTSNGSHFAWANKSSIVQLENTVLYGYYAAFGVMLLLIFIFLPFAYFAKAPALTPEEDVRKVAVVRGVKYTFGTFSLLCTLLVIGMVIPMRDLPTKNGTIYNQLHYISEPYDFINIVGDGFVFVINCLGLIGMIYAILHASYGMSILPINLIKGKPTEPVQMAHMESSIHVLMERVKELSNQQADQRPLSNRERQLLNKYSRQLSEMQSRSDSIRHQSYSFAWCKRIQKPIQMLLGIILLLLSFFIVLDICLSNANRIYSSLGMYSGYLTNQMISLNPIDYILLLSDKVFPLDYVVLGIIIVYITLSCVSGMQHIGIWFLWVKLHQLRSGRSSVQTLLCSAFVLALVSIYSYALAYTLAPQYVTYGTQVYKMYDGASTYVLPNKEDMDYIIAPCSLFAPADECTMTRLMTLQIRLFYRIWFIGVAYFWCSWLFVLVFLIGVVVSIIRKRKTIAEIMVRDNREEEFGSQERLI